MTHYEKTNKTENTSGAGKVFSVFCDSMNVFYAYWSRWRNCKVRLFAHFPFYTHEASPSVLDLPHEQRGKPRKRH